MNKRSCLFLVLSCILSIIQAIPLFEYNTNLEKAIPYVQLASLPTPIYECYGLETTLGHPHIFVKRDDLTAGGQNLYGGNKVRKLEFLLGDALAHNAKRIITFGCTGSNHALATACYSHQLGLDCLLMLKHQPNSAVVRQNLLLDTYFGATIELFPNNQKRAAALKTLLAEDKESYFFPTGGSVGLGALGYVNAALELRDQIHNGLLPYPDYIYVPVGSCGTVAGLLLGLQLAELNCHIIAVVVEPAEDPNVFKNRTEQLFKDANQLLHKAHTTIALYDFPQDQITFNHEFKGPNYGVLIPEAQDAINLAETTEKITLEGTYSAKGLAAIKKDIAEDKINKNQTILWWNTYCGLDFSSLTATIDYKNLPSEVHNYFEQI